MRAKRDGQKRKLNWWLWAGLAAFAVYLVHGWGQAKLGALELPLLFVLSGLCLLPLLRWFKLGMSHLPLGEGFAFMHLVYYVNPCLGAEGQLADYPAAFRAKALLAVIIYLAVLNLVYWRLTRRTVKTSPPLENLLRREVESVVFWALLGLWVVLNFCLLYGFLPDFGSAFNAFRATVAAIGSIALVCIFYRCGNGRYGFWHMATALACLGLGVAISCIGGSLIHGACELGAALLAYALGRKKLTISTILLSLIVVLILGFLQLGKAGYRSALSTDQSGYTEVPHSILQAYNLWFRIAWLEVTTPKESQSKATIFNRASLIQVLAVAMDTVPHKLPYMFGQTYGMIPELLVPRVLWPEKIRGTYPTEVMAFYIGIRRSTNDDEVTGVAVGSPAEGWLNFGWLGLALEGILFAVFFGLPARLSGQLEPQHIGWLACCVFLFSCVDMEHSFPEMFCATLAGFVMSCLLLLMISAPPKAKSLRKIKSEGLTIDSRRTQN